MGDALGIMHAMYIVIGIYMIVIMIRAAKGGEVSSSLLWDRTKPIEKCKDREGFIRYLYPRVLICGVVMALCGVISLVSASYEFLPDLEMYSLIPLFAVFVFFTYVIRKATETFF